MVEDVSDADDFSVFSTCNSLHYSLLRTRWFPIQPHTSRFVFLFLLLVCNLTNAAVQREQQKASVNQASRPRLYINISMRISRPICRCRSKHVSQNILYGAALTA